MLGQLTGRKKVKSKLITLAACLAAAVFCQAALAADGTQDTPAPASSAASHDDATADRPARVDEDHAQPPPRYSSAMKSAGSGTVVLMVKVGVNGKAQSVHVMMSSNTTVLDDEAIRTVKSWTYKPAIKNGAPAEGYVQVPITFNK